jgi:hypothetical protein
MKRYPHSRTPNHSARGKKDQTLARLVADARRAICWFVLPGSPARAQLTSNQRMAFSLPSAMGQARSQQRPCSCCRRITRKVCKEVWVLSAPHRCSTCGRRRACSSSRSWSPDSLSLRLAGTVAWKEGLSLPLPWVPRCAAAVAPPVVAGLTLPQSTCASAAAVLLFERGDL